MINNNEKTGYNEKTMWTEISTKQKAKIDYKSPMSLYQFISEGGKIHPARMTGLRHSDQRKLRKAVKKARRLSLLPSSARAYDDFGYPEQISPVPFKV